jgi:hypothetical protein
MLTADEPRTASEAISGVVFPCTFFQHAIEQRYRASESCAFEPFYGSNKIYQAFLRGHVEQAQRSSDTESMVSGNCNSLALVDQHDIGVKEFSQRDSGGFSLIQAGHLG